MKSFLTVVLICLLAGCAHSGKREQ
jgi:hypothetical protein